VRRRLAYVLVWTLATTATMGASWLGIRSVLHAAAPSRTTPLSAVELRQAAPTQTTPPPAPASPSRAPAAGPSPSASASPSASWTPVPHGDGGTAYRRTFRVRGGTVTCLVEPSGARVLDTQANRGFNTEQARPDPRSVMVSFISNAHVSRVYATWRNGPYAEITESVG
jgi:hypothetical protein